MLGSVFVCKGLQFPIDRLFYWAVQALCHFVQRPEELDRQEMSEKDADDQEDRTDRDYYRE